MIHFNKIRRFTNLPQLHVEAAMDKISHIYME